MDASTTTSIAGMVVAGVAAASAYASQRAASKASVVTTSDTNRTTAEQGAYERARAFDTETIRRQDEEIDELRASIVDLKNQVKALIERIDRQEITRQDNNDQRRIEEDVRTNQE